MPSTATSPCECVTSRTTTSAPSVKACSSSASGESSHSPSLIISTYPLLLSLLVQELVKACLESTKHKIDWLTDLERQAFTLNTHYLADYRDKFLAHYKGARQAGEHGDFIDRIRRYVPADEGEDAISKILSGLVELGVAGVKPEDIPKLLPPDEMEPAIEIMADVRAYFQGGSLAFFVHLPCSN